MNEHADARLARDLEQIERKIRKASFSLSDDPEHIKRLRAFLLPAWAAFIPQLRQAALIDPAMVDEG
jgi:hypothetical protein